MKRPKPQINVTEKEEISENEISVSCDEKLSDDGLFSETAVTLDKTPKKKSVFLTKTFMVNIFVVLALAIFTGVQVGLFYLDTFVKSYAPPTVEEQTLRDDTLAIYNASVGKSPLDVGAVNAAIVADYILTNSTCVEKTTIGTIVAMGVKQQMAASKKRVGNRIFSEKISTGVISVGNRFYHTLESDLFEFYSGTNVTITGATWPSSPSYTWNYDTYIEHFRSKPEYFINYIISSKTVQASSISSLPNGNFLISLDLDTVYSVLNYCYEIRETSGSTKFPNFKAVHLDMIIDSSYKVIELKVEENYDVAVVQLGGGYVDTHASIVDRFSYKGVLIDEA